MRSLSLRDVKATHGLGSCMCFLFRRSQDEYSLVRFMERVSGHISFCCLALTVTLSLESARTVHALLLTTCPAGLAELCSELNASTWTQCDVADVNLQTEMLPTGQ